MPNYGFKSGPPPFEPADETPPSIPVVDRFINITGADGFEAKAVSPTGRQVAWVETYSAEQLHPLRSILRNYHVLPAPPAYDLWVGDLNQHNKHRVAAFGHANLDSCDVRWSPDEKHISCFSVSQKIGPQVRRAGPNDFSLTVFDVD